MISFSSFQEQSALIDVFPLVEFILIVKVLEGTLVMVLSCAPTPFRNWENTFVICVYMHAHAMRVSVHCTVYSTVLYTVILHTILHGP